ncbi:MAG TPA: penicillin acylase family protein [Longimicrobiales bacterium]|nr:penicillin acylase family protein [Longimicrobiales bacterium]
MSRHARAGIAHAIIATLLVVIAVAIAAVVTYVRSSVPRDQGIQPVSGFAAPVTIGFDSLGVPYVRAHSVEDAYFAQGWLHARDRLWQMEMTRRAAQGRLAEVLGDKALDSDRFLRTIGLWRAARTTADALDPRSRHLAEAYIAGVNAWLAHHHGALPPEFLALRFRPEPWTVQDVMGVEKIMALTLSEYERSVAATRAAVRLGDTIRSLLPAYPGWGATILGSARPKPVPRLAAALLDGLNVARASNGWVIGGAHTRSGKPILANDPHLPLEAPSLWYLMAMHADGLDVSGMTLPGSPFVVLGHNRAIAWGMTNAMVDDVDLFVERRDPADSSRYLTPGGSQPFQRIEQQIQVRGRDRPVPLQILVTRHGPIVSDVAPGLGDRLIALRWTAQDPAHTVRALDAINRASGWDDFVRAMRDFDDPSQNVVYADTAGHIGYYMGGTVPLRNGHKPPMLPVPGWTGAWDWTGTLPFDQHPHVLDPPDGFIVTANNKQAAGSVADLISQDWEEPFRAMRILQMVHAGGPFDAADVAAMQIDVKDVKAERYVNRAIAAASTDSLADAARLLASWDLRATPSSPAAAVFYLWLDALRNGLDRRLYGDAAPADFMPRAAVSRMLERQALPWVSGPDAGAGFRALAHDAMRSAVARAHGRTWGEVHEVLAPHVLGGVALLEDIFHFNVGPASSGGAPTTVNAAQSHRSDTKSGLPLISSYGPSMRHVVDMGDIDGAGGFILGTGESGIPFSPHYRDQFPRWLNGGLWRVPLDSATAAARTPQHLTLEPQTRGRP